MQVLTPQEIEAAQSAWTTWTPRPDRPEEFDQQAGFVEAKDKVSFALGGNGSGKTAAAAKKCARFLISTPPPRKDTPFWIIAKTYYQVCAVCWGEKLGGQQFLPKAAVDWPNVTYYDVKRRWPLYVPLKPHANGNNWVIEFKSYEQGRENMQARSIGGFWFSEQFPWELFVEVLRGCRDYMFPGGQFCEFTPIDPELCMAMENIQENMPKGFNVYRLNTELNRENLADDWYDAFFGSVPDEMLATRKTGALATFEGVIYQSFNPAVHVIEDDERAWRLGAYHHRGIDWGASVEHPFACLWGCYDAVGDWFIYDEYWNTSQDRITQDHAAEIVARSIAWGWDLPEWWKKPGSREFLKTMIEKRVAQLAGSWPEVIHGRTYGESFADPSRPGEINAFNHYGVPTSSAMNDVYKGIDVVRTKLKVNPITRRPSLYVHKRCKHFIEEMRKYRWTKKRPGSMWVTAAPRPVPLKKDDDTADAGRYLIATVESRRGAAPTSSSQKPLDEHRREVPLDRPGNGRQRFSPQVAGEAGWFKR